MPFTKYIDQVQEWIKLLVNKTYTIEGFSLTDHRNGLLACHNAIITTILIKMEYNQIDKIQTEINWILKYQNVERGIESNWTGTDLNTRFNGCMKKHLAFLVLLNP